VAHSEQARTKLGWQPRHDDLATIVNDALAWQRTLMARTNVIGGSKSDIIKDRRAAG
jgi:UDP-glucose 4-epimerase